MALEKRKKNSFRNACTPSAKLKIDGVACGRRVS